MTVLAVEKLDAHTLIELLHHKKNIMYSDIEVLEIQDGAAKIEIEGKKCNTIAMWLVFGIAEKKDIEELLKNENLVFKWL